MGSVKDREVMKSLYACADLLVFPSLYDNQPLVVKEAAAFSVPSVLIDGSSAAEGIIHGYNGFLTSDNPESLADTLSGLLDKPNLVRYVGSKAQETLYVHWEEIADELYSIYFDLINTNEKILTSVYSYS